MRRGVATGFVLLIAYAVSAAPAGAALATFSVAVQDNRYVPDAIVVHVGDTVVWADQGVNPHSVTADDGSFDSSPACIGLTGCMSRGQTFRHTFPTDGTFAYHCKIHQSSGMVGVVTVLGASQPPTTVTTRRTTTTRAGSSTTTAAGGPTTTATLAPGGAVGIDETSSSDSTGSAAGDSGGSDSGSRGVVILVVALAAVAAGGGALLWRLRPRG